MNDSFHDTDTFPVWATAMAATGFGFRMIRFAVLGGAIMATVVAGLMAFSPSVSSPSDDGPVPWQTTFESVGETGPFADILLLGLSFVLTAVFTVFFHRRVMLGAGADARLQLTAREGRFLVATVLYSLVIGLPALALTFAGGMIGTQAGAPALGLVGVSLAVVLVVFLFARFALAFPALAVDAPGTLIDQFRFSFEATKGRYWRLLGAYVCAYVLFMVLAMVLGAAMGALIAAATQAGVTAMAVIWLAVAVQGSLQFMALAMFASIASQAFIAWSGWTPPGAAPATDAPLA